MDQEEILFICVWRQEGNEREYNRDPVRYAALPTHKGSTDTRLVYGVEAKTWFGALVCPLISVYNLIKSSNLSKFLSFLICKTEMILTVPTYNLLLTIGNCGNNPWHLILSYCVELHCVVVPRKHVSTDGLDKARNPSSPESHSTEGVRKALKAFSVVLY